MRNKITGGGIILALIFAFVGCAPKRSIHRDYKEFESRAYRFFDLSPDKRVIVTFEVYEVDDFVGWDVSWGPADIKLIDPEGKGYSWKRTSDAFEGFDSVFYFEAEKPVPGKWQMAFTSRSRKKENFSIWMVAYSDKKGAYNKTKIKHSKWQ